MSKEKAGVEKSPKQLNEVKILIKKINIVFDWKKEQKEKNDTCMPWIECHKSFFHVDNVASSSFYLFTYCWYELTATSSQLFIMFFLLFL